MELSAMKPAISQLVADRKYECIVKSTVDKCCTNGCQAEDMQASPPQVTSHSYEGNVIDVKAQFKERH